MEKQEKDIETSNRYKRIETKRRRQRERFHMNTDFNEKLKQYQRDYYDKKKIRK